MLPKIIKMYNYISYKIEPELFTIPYLTSSCQGLIHRKTPDFALFKVKSGVFALYFCAVEDYN